MTNLKLANSKGTSTLELTKPNDSIDVTTSSNNATTIDVTPKTKKVTKTITPVASLVTYEDKYNYLMSRTGLKDEFNSEFNLKYNWLTNFIDGSVTTALKDRDWKSLINNAILYFESDSKITEYQLYNIAVIKLKEFCTNGLTIATNDYEVLQTQINNQRGNRSYFYKCLVNLLGDDITLNKRDVYARYNKYKKEKAHE